MMCLSSHNSYPISIVSWDEKELAAFKETKKRKKNERVHSQWGHTVHTPVAPMAGQCVSIFSFFPALQLHWHVKALLKAL